MFKPVIDCQVIDSFDLSEMLMVACVHAPKDICNMLMFGRHYLSC